MTQRLRRTPKGDSSLLNFASAAHLITTVTLRINNFQYAAEGSFQKICPFAAHTRKTNPRDDLIAKGIPIDNRRIIRRGIQFGPEVTREEKIAKKTIKDRGLIFACYQTSITDAFAFIQECKVFIDSF
jgi:deferrochelatase/peroxidase EfeB